MDWVELTMQVPPGEALSAVVRGTACRTRAGLFSEWASALEFPAHFGHNWDAFHDCVSEKTLWHSDPDGPPPVHPLTILVEDAARLLADAPHQDLETLLETLSDAATVQDGDEDACTYVHGFPGSACCCTTLLEDSRTWRTGCARRATSHRMSLIRQREQSLTKRTSADYAEALTRDPQHTGPIPGTAQPVDS